MGAANPFQDPILVPNDPPNVTEYTLAVGRGDATLTLATDSVILVDEGLARQSPTSCCGLSLPQKSIPTKSIPFSSILWAEVTTEPSIIVTHASPASRRTLIGTQTTNHKQVKVSRLEYALDKAQTTTAQTFVSRLLDRSYGASQRRKRIKVLVNPLGGTGRASKIYNKHIAPILAAANCVLDVETTRYKGHAKEIAQNIDTDTFDVIACCSGDGTPHEVFNGLGARKDARRALRKIAVVQLPCGSGNAMCHNLYGTESPSLAALSTVKGIRMPMDLLSVTQGSQRYLSFLSQAIGIVAESDLGTENLRWMGDARFTWGILSRILGKTVYPCDIAVQLTDDNKSSITSRHREHTALAKTPTQFPMPDLPDDASTRDADSGIADERHTNHDGLPPLKYGTIQDELPSSWTFEKHPTIGNFYCGNMAWMAADTLFFAAAMPSDGNVDMINIDGVCPRHRALGFLVDVGNGKLFENDLVLYRKVAAYRVIPHGRNGKQEEYISIDGEKVPFAPFQVEVHQGLGTVLSRSGKSFETPPLNS